MPAARLSVAGSLPRALRALAPALLLVAAATADAGAQGHVLTEVRDDVPGPTLTVAPSVASHVARRASTLRIAMPLEPVAGVPDTVRVADLARGVPLAVQFVDAAGRPLDAPVRWRVLGGDAALLRAEPRTDAEGHAHATLGRAPWLRARAGTVMIEVSAGASDARAPRTQHLRLRLRK